MAATTAPNTERHVTITAVTANFRHLQFSLIQRRDGGSVEASEASESWGSTGWGLEVEPLVGVREGQAPAEADEVLVFKTLIFNAAAIVLREMI